MYFMPSIINISTKFLAVNAYDYGQTVNKMVAVPAGFKIVVEVVGNFLYVFDSFFLDT